MKILIVRLGALGDIVHAVPALAALRAAFPAARIDWLVDARHRAFLEQVLGISRVVVLERRAWRGWLDVVRALKDVRYDVAFDLQGLMKSALLARASGARRVAGFSIWHLREKAARPFYSVTDDRSRRGGAAAPSSHVIFKNLDLLRVVGVESASIAFPLAHAESAAADQVRSDAGGLPFALINPGAAWPNKCWPPARFGEVARFLREVRGLRSVVLWGPGEAPLARAVVEASGGAASVAPPTDLPDLIALARMASLMVSGDTGPLHVAAAAGAPVVGIFGPTDPARNGPWAASDISVSRFETCACHYQRRCRRAGGSRARGDARWCLEDIGVAEVTAAIQQRLGSPSGAGPSRG